MKNYVKRKKVSKKERIISLSVYTIDEKETLKQRVNDGRCKN
jgi:hypothetical protein